MKKLITALLVLVMLFGMVSCNVIVNNGDDTTEATGTGTSYPHSDMTVADLNAIIATYGDNKYTVGTFKYYFMDAYSNFVSQYYYYLSYYGLNTSAPLHDQVFDADTGETWYEYFLKSGKSSFEQYAKFAIKAAAEGLTLSEADIKEIDDYLDGIEKSAAEYEMTFTEYMADYMGEGMTKDIMREAVKLSQLGYLYYNKIYSALTYTNEQVEAEYSSNLNTYALCDYETVTFNADYDETDDDAAVAAAKAAAVKKGEQFVALLNEGKTFAEADAIVNPVEVSTETSAETSTETTAPTTTPTEKTYTKTGVTYSSLESYSFIFESGAKVGDIKTTTSDDGDVTVVRALQLPYKDMTKTVNVRHILLDSSAYDTEEAAKAAADSLLAEINAASDPLAKFKELVPGNSSDTGSSSNGGLYEKVIPGQMVQTFNDWCFDPSRKVGDTGIVSSDYGFHVMYFDGFNTEVWYEKCETALRDADFDKKAQAVYDEITITYNEELLDAITK